MMRTYRLETNDALDGREVVTVKDPASGRVVWTKTRALTEDEMVATVYDSLHHPRWTIHRPRRPNTVTSSSSAPWPAYLVLRSPAMRPGAFIPIIAPRATKAKRKEAAGDKDEGGGSNARDHDALKFGLRTSAVPQHAAAARAGDKSSASGRDDALAGSSEGQPPTTPTTPRARQRARPLSTSVRVDMAPSLSASSSTSGGTSDQPLYASSEVPATQLRMRPSASQDSTSTPPPEREREREWVQSTFRLESSLPDSFVAASTSTPTRWGRGRASGFGALLLGRVRSWIFDEPRRWSCVWEEEEAAAEEEEGREGIEATGKRERVVMAFEEDSSGLVTAQTTGSLHLSPALVDAAGMEPSFFVAVGLAWMEVDAERRAWEAGRTGD
ncbi:hypothetical protein JCM1840_004456 [Sporobolomyces johnsonii]